MSSTVIGCVYELFQPEEFKPAPHCRRSRKWLPRRVDWREERNLYSLRSPLLGFSRQVSSEMYQTRDGRGKDLADWNRFWGLKDTGSR